MSNRLLDTYRRLQRLPGGGWLFSRAVCLKAPYFATISPRIVRLGPGLCEATIRHRRRVSNHIGTVHAIALCNLAELVAGLVTDASLPGSMRWIPRGMEVEYLKKAVGTIHAVATPQAALAEAARGYALPVLVEARNTAGEAVFRARISMWVSPRPAR